MSNDMPLVTVEDIKYMMLSDTDYLFCVDTARKLCESIVDRHDLHGRDIMEKFNNVLMGEVAEMMVIRWLQSNGKYAVSAVDKSSGQPDQGYDICLKNRKNREVRCSVKSSLSFKLPPSVILKSCKLASKRSEIKDVNIQVYFWLNLNPGNAGSRVTTPCINNAAIFSWLGGRDTNKFQTASYSNQDREVLECVLEQGRSMDNLLKFIS